MYKLFSLLATPKFDIKLDTSEISEKGLEVPVPKVRRVLPENEGGYKIKMPSGITERSKKILEQGRDTQIGACVNMCNMITETYNKPY